METIVAMLRICPLRNPDAEQDACLLEVDGESVVARDKIFKFSHVFSQKSTQEEVFHVIRQRLQSAFTGINGCFMTYGQTGTGKSYSIFGSSSNPGVLPRLMKEIFSPQRTVRVWITFVEIYQEQVRDLLCADIVHEKLNMIDHPSLGVVITNLTESPVESEEDVRSLLKFALTRRAVANTNMNSHSSRSHVVFTWRFLIDGKLTSKLRFVDLAGSERSYSARTGGQLSEGIAINSSLSMLGLVIKQLVESQKANLKSGVARSKPRLTLSSGRSSGGSAQTLPRSPTARVKFQSPRAQDKEITRTSSVSWRSSKLTFLLKDSLAGNSRSALLATCSSDPDNFAETVSTMRFAMQISSVRTVVQVTSQKDIVSALKDEIKRLKQRLYGAVGAQMDVSCPRSVVESEKLISQLETSFSDQIKEEKLRKTKRTTHLVSMGVIHDEDSNICGQIPYLLNIDRDPLLYGSVMYRLPVGSTSFGNSAGCSIKISGCGVGELVCKFITQQPQAGQSNYRVLLQNPNQCRILVNGHEIPYETELHTNDRLILGRALAFRLVVPDIRRPTLRYEMDHTADCDAILQDDVHASQHDGHEFWLCMGDSAERLRLLQETTKMVADANSVAAELQLAVTFSLQLVLGTLEPPLLVCQTKEEDSKILSYSEFKTQYWALTDKHHALFSNDLGKPARTSVFIETIKPTEQAEVRSSLGRSSRMLQPSSSDNLVDFIPETQAARSLGRNSRQTESNVDVKMVFPSPETSQIRETFCPPRAASPNLDISGASSSRFDVRAHAYGDGRWIPVSPQVTAPVQEIDASNHGYSGSKLFRSISHTPNLSNRVPYNAAPPRPLHFQKLSKSYSSLSSQNTTKVLHTSRRDDIAKFAEGQSREAERLLRRFLVQSSGYVQKMNESAAYVRWRQSQRDDFCLPTSRDRSLSDSRRLLSPVPTSCVSRETSMKDIPTFTRDDKLGTISARLPNFSRGEMGAVHIAPLKKNSHYLLWRKLRENSADAERNVPRA